MSRKTKNIDVNKLVGNILRLDREVERLATTGRAYIGQQVNLIGYLYRDTIEPEIRGTEEANEMERMLRAMEGFYWLDDHDWRRLTKARKQAIDVMRATTEIVARRFVRALTEGRNRVVQKTND